jgi:hypothetical protein
MEELHRFETTNPTYDHAKPALEGEIFRKLLSSVEYTCSVSY